MSNMKIQPESEVRVRTMSTNQHWGEFRAPHIIPHDVPKADSSTFEADTEFAMTTKFFDEFEETIEEKPTQTVTVGPLNLHMSHAIALHKYLNNTELSTQIPNIEDLPNAVANNLNLEKAHFQQFKLGVEVELPELSKSVVKQISHKFVATILAGLGYETSPREPLDILTDVLHECFVKITRKYNDSLSFHDGLSPLDKIEKILVETGFNGVKGLDEFYKTRVVKYLDVLEERCREKEAQLQQIPTLDSPLGHLDKEVKVKVEKDDDDDVIEVENSQVLAGEVNPSLLEAGYQLLQGLETNNWNHD